MEEQQKNTQTNDNTQTGGDGNATPPKKKRGNPAFQKGKRNSYYDNKKETNMAEDTKDTTTTQESNSQTDVKKDIPADIFSDVIPEAEVIPLAGEMNTKEYAGIKDGSETSGGGGSNKPPITPKSGDTASSSSDSSVSSDTTVSTDSGAKNPEEVRTEAEQMVKMMLRGYDKAHGLGRWAGKMDMNELMNQHLSGKINLEQELPLGKKGPIQVQQFFQDYNASIDENIVVTDKFKEEITPPLVRIAIKRKWTLGDELFVLGILTEDIATKVSMLIGLKKSANLILEACQSIMKNQKAAMEAKEENANPPKRETPVETANQEPLDNDKIWEQASAAETSAM